MPTGSDNHIHHALFWAHKYTTHNVVTKSKCTKPQENWINYDVRTSFYVICTYLNAASSIASDLIPEAGD